MDNLGWPHQVLSFAIAMSAALNYVARWFMRMDPDNVEDQWAAELNGDQWAAEPQHWEPDGNSFWLPDGNLVDSDSPLSLDDSDELWAY